MKYQTLSCLGLLLLPLATQAIEPGPASLSQQSTETWLLLQSRNQVKSPIPQNASPSERELTLQRWLDNYKHPIPEYYKEYVGSGGSGGSK
ncbi:DUF3613 domain-containing protein [Pseudomonas chlororaphis]|uniref:DUF3613 domain-containing protein n=1 Tax=Pseudomonas chlororaphis TaxID=587753 RepID=UPI0003D2DCF1|nr:DUF3613 domain-containing protein [Pseudomonas chlororaphis]AZD31329.1 hypothetical protein C4K23_4601 [Pseudomonas chlororaphis]ETD40184.1 hypothetical protein U724_08595 [Pseudomonas chlororaphis subsp. aurantiaca PB-St2]QFS56651.1 DUF3613 domain-containing protein [Pseudomonas chlororaphis subsp. aurantiaca]